MYDDHGPIECCFCCSYISAVFGEYLAWITVMNLVLGEYYWASKHCIIFGSEQ